MHRDAIVLIGAAVGLIGVGAVMYTHGAPSITPAAHFATSGVEGDRQALGFTLDRIDGTPQDLGEYKGSVVLIVNVASRCGLTGQYAGLQALYEAHKDEGFVVLGFPANNFMNQEPGSDEEIADFCQKNYGVTFPLFSKVSVKGDDQHPLYAKLTNMPEPIGGEIQWNFQKYLVDIDGNVVAKFEPRVTPDDERLAQAIRDELARRSGV